MTHDEQKITKGHLIKSCGKANSRLLRQDPRWEVCSKTSAMQAMPDSSFKAFSSEAVKLNSLKIKELMEVSINCRTVCLRRVKFWNGSFKDISIVCLL
jgi:hypothetical protein